MPSGNTKSINYKFYTLFNRIYASVGDTFDILNIPMNIIYYTWNTSSDQGYLVHTYSNIYNSLYIPL